MIEGKVSQPQRLPRQPARPQARAGRDRREPLSADPLPAADAEELSHWSAELKQAASLREAAEDLFWALLNSREFAFNH